MEPRNGSRTLFWNEESDVFHLFIKRNHDTVEPLLKDDPEIRTLYCVPNMLS